MSQALLGVLPASGPALSAQQVWAEGWFGGGGRPILLASLSVDTPRATLTNFLWLLRQKVQICLGWAFLASLMTILCPFLQESFPNLLILAPNFSFLMMT